MKKAVLYLSIFILVAFVGGTLYVNQRMYSAQAKESAMLQPQTRTLYWGSRGEDVRKVQSKLSQWGYYFDNVDGIYGPSTYRAVRRFQRANGLTEDGVVGPATAKAIGISLTTAEAPASTGLSREGDVYLIAKAIHGEARGEPYVGKVAVGAVILNRVKHPSFPNTIAGVIYQPLAFTAVADGQINLEPDKDSIKAARDSINGWDPTYGCRYYWNPVTATSKWIWSRQVIIKIGKHWFGN
ncbi:N-acetylmuramoyl-L-alanine amidase [Proteiniborus ethanoligenes]|uniref:Spore cortex-lytic enzyme n=1 Tax=Proteiniborus ethanoligenes TaxID=415015 RepID=A0A1H3M120_9FIRM|nr:spore cortex-lytic enzyme [Proteiniborus ethanoligenes]SDY70392.1 N-acetylmuramoyl-L-alanine amidase [Proteiniborus ethanoligenes]